MPPPISSQSDRSRFDAPASLGNHTRGTETTRPSESVTHNASREHETSTASVSTFATKVLMPFPQEQGCVLHHDFPNLDHLVRPETPDVGDRHAFEPKLRVAPGVSDVDVRRLPPLHTEEEEPIPTDPQYGGHVYSLPPRTICI